MKAIITFLTVCVALAFQGTSLCGEYQIVVSGGYTNVLDQNKINWIDEYCVNLGAFASVDERLFLGLSAHYNNWRPENTVVDFDWIKTENATIFELYPSIKYYFVRDREKPGALFGQLGVGYARAAPVTVSSRRVTPDPPPAVEVEIMKAGNGYGVSIGGGLSVSLFDSLDIEISPSWRLIWYDFEYDNDNVLSFTVISAGACFHF